MQTKNLSLVEPKATAQWPGISRSGEGVKELSDRTKNLIKATAVAALACVAASAHAQTVGWSGGGADNNWSTAGNWNAPLVSPAALTFGGSARLTNNNDLASFAANSIAFDSTAGAFTLNGNSIGLNGNISFSANPALPVTQTINLPLAATQDITVGTRSNGNITINGAITGGNQLTQVGPDNAGILTLAGANALKGLVVNNGTNRITGATTITGIGGSSFFYLADGQTSRTATLIIENGATLTVTGGFQDAGVIGRDGGVATIIQNGGTFSFGINDGPHNYLFVGASGNSNTRAVYNMNGGVLDMNGDTLGIALGANTVITGAVNQVGGVITNVGNLFFDPFFVQGHGIYNLTGGSIYIGAGGITVQPGGSYEFYAGGGMIGAEANWSSSLNMTLTGTNGPVTFNPAGNTIALSGILSGPGGLTVSGGGTLELSGANTYAGATTVNVGSVLQLDNTGSSLGAFRVNTGGLLNLNFAGNYVVGSFYTNGVALAVGTYNAGNLPAFITGSGNLQVVSGISTGQWTGRGANNNWSTAENWDNNAVPIFPHALIFSGNTRLANNNDLSGITVSDLTFDAAAGAFQLNGNDITLSGNVGFNGNPSAPITQTINLNQFWTADKTINTPGNGNLSLGGNIAAANNNLTKTGNGTLTLGGVDTFVGYYLNGGTNVITGNVTINGANGSFIFIGNADPSYNGTLIIQPGASFSVSGQFNDAFVIGRNGGSGRVIQNGGTFSYNNPSHPYLFVGATSQTGTHAEYDMNGGVLDLNGGTLGPALGDNGVSFNGVFNQTGGDVLNVFNLNLGAVRNYGHGVYNLSGGSIAIDFGGITSDSKSYEVNLGGGIVRALSTWSSSLDMNLTNFNGSVTFDPQGNLITLSGNLSGNGGLIVTNSGVLELSGASSYTGDTIVSAGATLQLDATGTGFSAIRVASGAYLNLNFNGTYIVPALYANNVSLPEGTYNSGNLSTYIYGSGSLKVVKNISTGLWDGGGASDNWSTADNWDQNVMPVFPIGLTFAGNLRKVNNNDLTGITASSITFDSAAGPFVLNGNDVTLTGNIGFNANPAAPVTQTVNLNMTWNGNRTVDLPANGNLTLGGSLALVNDLTKTGNGTLTLGGNDTFASFIVNGGTIRITGNTTLNGTGGSRFALANASASYNGTLIIENGAVFNVTGNFTDAGVIGRDGGKGTIIQNGGTFTFNMANQPYLFIGATGNSATRAEYHMNGGLLDMSGKTLGISLGAGVLVTGVVSQVSGVIANVGNLQVGSVTPNGYGIYTLSGGSISIGSGGITTSSGLYEINLGGGTVGATANWNSSLNMNLTGNNGSVTFDTAANTITLSGSLSGNGGLTKIGNGTLRLSGANSYAGDTTVNAGTLQLDRTSSISGAIRLASGAVLNLDFTGTQTVAALYVNGVAVSSGVYTSSNLPGVISGAGAVKINSTLPTTPTPITFGVSGGNLTITWPANYQGWILQVQTNALNVGLSTNWVDVAGSANVTSTNLPITPGTPTTFYRLRLP